MREFFNIVVKLTEFWDRETLADSLALSIAGFLKFGKLFNLSKLKFPFLWREDNSSNPFISWWCVVIEVPALEGPRECWINEKKTGPTLQWWLRSFYLCKSDTSEAHFTPIHLCIILAWLQVLQSIEIQIPLQGF